MNCALMFMKSNRYGRITLSLLVRIGNDMFKVISNTMVKWYRIIIAKIMNCALMFIISNRYGRIVLSSLIQLGYGNDMFKVISNTIHNGILR